MNPHLMIADVFGLARGMGDEAGRDAAIDVIMAMTPTAREEILISALVALHAVVVGVCEATDIDIDAQYDTLIANTLKSQQ